MELVSFKNSLLDHNTTFSTIDALVQKIQTIPTHQALKLDLELTLYICKVVENIIGSKSSTSTIDKSTIVINVFQAIYPDLTDDQIAYIKQQIQYFWANKLIKRVPALIRLGIFTFNLVKKKFV